MTAVFATNAPTGWQSWPSPDPVVALVIVEDDGTVHRWANRRLLAQIGWPAIERWELAQAGARCAILTEADLATVRAV